jgi:probable O-glycosylation ligase (exosortase A-associated)
MLRGLVVLSILIPGLLVAITNEFAALLLYLWFALFRPQEWMYWDISRFRPSLVLGVVLLIVSLMKGKLPNLSHPVSIGSILFLLSALLGQLNAPMPAIGWNWIDYLVRMLLVCLLLISIVSEPWRFRLLLAVVAGSFGVHAAKAGAASILGGGVRFFDGLAGAFGDNNGYAVGMAMVIPLLLAAAQNAPWKWASRAFYVSIPFAIVAIISTFSRGGFLAVMTGLVALALLQRRRAAALIALASLAVPLGMFMASQEGYLDRLKTIQTYEQTGEESALSRLHFWQVAAAMAADQPLGIGLFNYEAAYDRYDFSYGQYGSRRSVHSSHFQALAETGFLGFAIFEGLLLYGVFCATRVRRRSLTRGLDDADARLFFTAANALIAGIAAFAVGGAFVAMTLNDMTWMLLAMAAALDLISARACVRITEPAISPELQVQSARLRWQPHHPEVAR